MSLARGDAGWTGCVGRAGRGTHLLELLDALAHQVNLADDALESAGELIALLRAGAIQLLEVLCYLLHALS